MKHAAYAREFTESRIEDEPILGTVLVMPDGRIQPLTLMQRIRLMFGLTDAKSLETHYRMRISDHRDRPFRHRDRRIRERDRSFR